MAKAKKTSTATSAKSPPAQAKKQSNAAGKATKGATKATATSAPKKSAPKKPTSGAAASTKQATARKTAAKATAAAKKTTAKAPVKKATTPKATATKKAAVKQTTVGKKAAATKSTSKAPATAPKAATKTATAPKKATTRKSATASTSRKAAAAAKPVITVADLNNKQAAPALDASGKMAPRVQNPPLTARQKKELKQALTDERDRVLTFIADVDDKSIGHNRGDGERSRSSYSIHQADYASDNQSLNLALMQRQIEAQRLDAIEWALKRAATKHFGKCRRCSANIGYERMQAVPYAEYCILCRADLEESPS